MFETFFLLTYNRFMSAETQNKGQYITDFPSDYTVIDIETTGLSVHNNEIIELSALKVRGDKIIEKYSTLIKPEGKISSFISNLTGITNEMVQNSPKITEVLPSFTDFLADDCIIGHNVHFDMNFIYNNLKKYFNKELPNNYTDTMKLSRKYCKLPSHRLSYLAEKFGISTQGHHRALNDCIMTFEIYKRIKQTANSEQIPLL